MGATLHKSRGLINTAALCVVGPIVAGENYRGNHFIVNSDNCFKHSGASSHANHLHSRINIHHSKYKSLPELPIIVSPIKLNWTSFHSN